jgi:hypothetical protein
MPQILSNWKTTSAGLVAIITSGVHLIFQMKAHTLTETDCSATLIAIALGLGAIFAGDASASTQKPPTPPNP